jgi:hypothetical protein
MDSSYTNYALTIYSTKSLSRPCETVSPFQAFGEVVDLGGCNLN